MSNHNILRTISSRATLLTVLSYLMAIVMMWILTSLGIADGSIHLFAWGALLVGFAIGLLADNPMSIPWGSLLAGAASAALVANLGLRISTSQVHGMQPYLLVVAAFAFGIYSYCKMQGQERRWRESDVSQSLYLLGWIVLFISMVGFAVSAKLAPSAIRYFGGLGVFGTIVGVLGAESVPNGGASRYTGYLLIAAGAGLLLSQLLQLWSFHDASQFLAIGGIVLFFGGAAAAQDS